MSVLSDLADYLEDNGLGTVGTDIFYSYAPGTVAPGIFVLDDSGLQPGKYVPTKKPGFQVFIRAVDYDTGNTKLESVRSLLHNVRNTLVGSTYFYYILARANGGSIGRNEAGHDEFSINFDSEIR